MMQANEVNPKITKSLGRNLQINPVMILQIGGAA